MTELFIWLTIFSNQSPQILNITKNHEVYCYGEKVSTLKLIELNNVNLKKYNAYKVCEVLN